eukprot:7624603-Prorocentrum_lima.AAC.1
MTSSLVGSEMCIRDSQMATGCGCCGRDGSFFPHWVTGKNKPSLHQGCHCLLYTSDAADDM